MSLYETFNHGPHAYFDASISLLFFLLIGRTLDHMMRERARAAVKGLARLAARGALVVRAGRHANLSPAERDRAGHDHPAGGRRAGPGRWPGLEADSPTSIVRSSPAKACRSRHASGSLLQAGTLNLTGPLTIAATAAAKNSFLAEMVRMMEAAEVRALGVPAHRRPRVPTLRSRGSRDRRG